MVERYPRAFVLVRDEDVSGVSGTGHVAEGVEFRDGTVALRWLSSWPTSVVFHDRGIDGVKAVHGHGGRTRIAYLDNGAAREAADLRDETETLRGQLDERGEAAATARAERDVLAYLLDAVADGSMTPAEARRRAEGVLS